MDFFVFLKRNHKEYRDTIFNSPVPETYEQFLNSVEDWFSHGRQYQFLIYHKYSNRVVGTIFFYGDNNSGIKCSVYIEKSCRGGFLAIESLLATVLFARNVLNLNHLLFSVFVTNKKMLHFLDKIIKKGDNILIQSEVRINKIVFRLNIKNSEFEKLISRYRI